MFEVKKNFSQVGIHLNETQEKQFQNYIDLILTWNKRTNLISRKDEKKIIENHFFESLAFLLSFELYPGINIVDVGSGAGFPALPISLVKTDINFLMVESKRMKTLFLKEVVSQLKLENVEVLCERVENLTQHKKYENKFDFAFSRAVSSLEIVYGWIEKLLKPGGFYIAWKGGKVEQEIKELQNRYREIEIDVVKMDQRLVPLEKERVFVQVKKINL